MPSIFWNSWMKNFPEKPVSLMELMAMQFWCSAVLGDYRGCAATWLLSYTFIYCCKLYDKMVTILDMYTTKNRLCLSACIHTWICIVMIWFCSISEKYWGSFSAPVLFV
jgi:hypothetical protein